MWFQIENRLYSIAKEATREVHADVDSLKIEWLERDDEWLCLRAQVERLEAQNARYEHMIAQLRRLTFVKRSEGMDKDQLSWRWRARQLFDPCPLIEGCNPHAVIPWGDLEDVLRRLVNGQPQSLIDQLTPLGVASPERRLNPPLKGGRALLTS